MTFENTLLGRCCTAYEERHAYLGPFDDELPLCLASVLEHLAAEIKVLHQAEPRLTVHELARRLIYEAGAAMPEPVEPPERHPSLTARERNPSLS
jgi:hypothetical protein